MRLNHNLLAPVLIPALICLAAGGAIAASPPAAAPTPALSDAALLDQCIEEQDAQEVDRSSCVGVVIDRCTEAPGGETTYGQMDCAKREIALWDKKLNETYQALLAEGSPTLKTALREAQRAWVLDKDKTCAIPYAYFEGGTIAGPLGGLCVNEMTAMRYILLDQYLHYAE